MAGEKQPRFPFDNPIRHLRSNLLLLGLRAIYNNDERCIKLLRDFIEEHNIEHQADLKRSMYHYVERAEWGEMYRDVVVALTEG